MSVGSLSATVEVVRRTSSPASNYLNGVAIQLLILLIGSTATQRTVAQTAMSPPALLQSSAASCPMLTRLIELVQLDQRRQYHYWRGGTA